MDKSKLKCIECQKEFVCDGEYCDDEECECLYCSIECSNMEAKRESEKIHNKCAVCKETIKNPTTKKECDKCEKDSIEHAIQFNNFMCGYSISLHPFDN
jgi:hypothetical protein